MKASEREKLNLMLLQLMSAQDNVTHCNEHGLHERMRVDIRKRDVLRNDILDYVESLLTQK